MPRRTKCSPKRRIEASERNIHEFSLSILLNVVLNPFLRCATTTKSAHAKEAKRSATDVDAQLSVKLKEIRREGKAERSVGKMMKINLSCELFCFSQVDARVSLEVTGE